MTYIKFERDYGYRDPSQFWIVVRDEKVLEIPVANYTTREDAQDEAARQAIANPGKVFHVMASIAQVSTKIEVIGKNFDPTMSAPKDPKSDEVL